MFHNSILILLPVFSVFQVVDRFFSGFSLHNGKCVFVFEGLFFYQYPLDFFPLTVLNYLIQTFESFAGSGGKNNVAHGVVYAIEYSE